MTDVNRLSAQDVYLLQQAQMQAEQTQSPDSGQQQNGPESTEDSSARPALNHSQKTAASAASLETAASQILPNHKMSTAAKVILGIFTLGIGAAVAAVIEHLEEVKQRDLASSMLHLKDDLSTLKLSDGPASVSAKILGDEVKFEYDPELKLLRGFILIDGQYEEIPLSKDIDGMITALENDILQHVEFYGRKAAAAVLEQYLGGTHAAADKQRLRECCFALLKDKCGLNETEYGNLRTGLLLFAARMALDNTLQPEVFVNRLIAPLCSRDLINSEDCLLLLQKMEEEPQNSAVELPPEGLYGLQQSHRSGQSSEMTAQLQNELKLRSLAADLIYSEETWEHDKLLSAPGERLRSVLLKHLDDLMLIKDHPEIVQDCGMDLSVLNPENLARMLGVYTDKLPGGALLAQTPLSSIKREKLEGIIANAPAEQFKELEGQIDVNVNAAFRDIQTLVSRQFATLAESHPMEERSDADLTLDEMYQRTLDFDSPGYAQFMQKSFDRYFTDCADIDKRSMLASYLRGSNSKSSLGQQAGALFKGAGPIMQKMLQGFNVNNMNEDFKKALSDMKSNLTPIPEKIVQAYLADMVQRSHGQVSRIEVKRSLGAASVGQALLCTMHKTDGSSEMCVVKLLRPDVQNRALREQEIFRQAAAEVPGMSRTFEGQLERIKEELDLRVEARNIEEGRIYDESGNTEVKSMKLNPLIEPTANSMVLQMAPGSTLEKYAAEVKERTLKLIEPFVQRDEEGKPRFDEQGRPLFDSGKEITIAEIEAKLHELAALYSEVDHSMHCLNALTAKWIIEGLYDGGFYHGDLHAGNIMLEAKGPEGDKPPKAELTVIDFGNATKLTDAQQKYVTQMISGAAAALPDIFVKGYKGLLSEEGRQNFAAQETEIMQTINTVLSKGSSADTGKRIAVLLTKLQQLGLELPGPIYNFSQCQMRLQGTVESMEAALLQIRELSTAFAEKMKPTQEVSFINFISTAYNVGLSGYVSALGMHKVLMDNLDHPDGPMLQQLTAQLSAVQSSETAAEALNALLSSPNISAELKARVSQAHQDYIAARTEAGLPRDLNEVTVGDAAQKLRAKLEMSQTVLTSELAKGEQGSAQKIAQLQQTVARQSAELEKAEAQQQLFNQCDPQLVSLTAQKRNELVKAVLDAQRMEADAYARGVESLKVLQHTPIPKFFVTVGTVIMQNLSSTFSRLGLIDAMRLRSFAAHPV